MRAALETQEKWNENIETCSDCGIKWKKIGKSCPVCYAPAAKEQMHEHTSIPKSINPALECRHPYSKCRFMIGRVKKYRKPVAERKCGVAEPDTVCKPKKEVRHG